MTELFYNGYRLHADQDGNSVLYEVYRGNGNIPQTVGFSFLESEAEVIERLRSRIERRVNSFHE